MFTGLVEEIGTVRAATHARGGYQLVIAARDILEDMRFGDSIAVNGACLTVTDFDAESFTVGLAPETRAKTALEDLAPGAAVALERAALPTTRLGGHYVQGHIDGTGVIQSFRADEDALWMTVNAPAALMRYIVPKGYIAIDGASLTVVHAGEDWFDVTLIAYSQEKLALPRKRPGDRVNLEVDILAKYAESRVSRPAPLPQAGGGGLASIPDAIDAFRAGAFVIIVDDEDRENEGDLVLAADFVTPEAVNFCAREGRGLVCCAMAGDLIDKFRLPMMVPAEENRSGFGTAFTVSVEAATGVTTGISAADRARTIRTLIDPKATRADIVTPGHVFPLRAREGGVLERGGQTEAGVDLARLSGLIPAAMICEVMKDDGEMARLPDLEIFAARHGLKIITVKALADYRRAVERPRKRRAAG
ncbi:MAG: 3,4-dihydroxy-2-butanone-4-phosphate synthase [Amphiplicatus sp.]